MPARVREDAASVPLADTTPLAAVPAEHAVKVHGLFVFVTRAEQQCLCDDECPGKMNTLSSVEHPVFVFSLCACLFASPGNFRRVELSST